MKPRNLSVLSSLTALSATLPLHAAILLNPRGSRRLATRRARASLGDGHPGEKVIVKFAGQSVASGAAGDGKWLVRLAPLAMGEPRPLTVTGKNTIVLTNQLVAKDGALKGFTIAGTDKVFRPTQAEIRGDTIVVSAADVAQPVAMRYGWVNVSEGNLFNRAGLPASPFRTDAD